jgi:hypothetical protein
MKTPPWYDLPTPLAVPLLVEMRNKMRERNLYDTEEPPMAKRADSGPVPADVQGERTADGSWNDLGCPHMGATGRRFGRNFPLQETEPDIANLLNPNPRDVSRTLLTRHEFQPATILNLNAASWIQFMVHDWFMHKNSDTRNIEIPLHPDDPWPDHPMHVPATEVDPTPAGSTHPPAYANQNSHWWDGSQIYGCDTTTCAKLRTGADGKLHIGADRELDIDAVTGRDLTGFTENSWVGVDMLHTLFTLEHNAICDMLKSAYPQASDPWLYAKARLVNAALLAKIHTVEWTPAILPQKTIALAMNTNWHGLAGEGLQDIFPFLNDNELLGGIVGSSTNHHSAPYSLTEEFTSVYRMHALVPDEFEFRAISGGASLGTYQLPDVVGPKGREIMRRIPLADLFYSFGIGHPGAVRLHNFPRHLQNLTREDGAHVDLGTIDILRDRERGVPRYNRFRRLLGKDPVTSFEELTDIPEWREELRRVYENDLEKVDLMVGLYCEPLPAGFGFSETAFRIFVLMASRRLKSDRFFTNDFRPEMYTKEGFDWVRQNGFASVLRRHVPAVAPALEGVHNPFAPWKKVG